MVWHTSAAIDWMKTILQERFGHIFNLMLQNGGSQLVLQLLGEERYIMLDLDGPTFISTDSNLPCSVWNADAEGWPTALSSSLHAPGLSAVRSSLVEITAQGFHIHYDILGMVYWMLTRQEEVGRTDLDEHGRFPARSSHAFKFGYLERPLVDEWLYVLGQIIKRQWPNIILKKHNFIMRVSHDVDQPSMYAYKPWKTIARMMTGHILKRQNYNAFLAAPYVKLATRERLSVADPYNTFDWLMDVSEANNLKSAFYFICGRTDRSKDADYEIEHPVIRNLLRLIHKRGHEIGLHPSYNTFRSTAAIKHEADRLKHICAEEGIEQDQWGGRMHYLRWAQPTTMCAWSDAGMSYDSTLGYADHAGFRCGSCHEYPAFDAVRQEQLKLRIRPLIAMECSVIDETYMGLGSGREAEEKFLFLKDSCKQVQGCFSLLWHNSYLGTENLKSIYTSLLANKINVQA